MQSCNGAGLCSAVSRCSSLPRSCSASCLRQLALTPSVGQCARCGVLRSTAVERRTALFLLRLRYLLHEGEATGLAEETAVWGVSGFHPHLAVLDAGQAASLLDAAQASASVPPAEKREVLAETLGWWPQLHAPVGEFLAERGWRRSMRASVRCWAAANRALRCRHRRTYWAWWCCCRSQGTCDSNVVENLNQLAISTYDTVNESDPHTRRKRA